MSGKKPRPRKSSKGASRHRVASRTKASDARLYGGLAALVVGLGALVWWSLPDTRPAPASVEEAGAEDDEPGEAREGERRPRAGRWERPALASAELAVVTDRPDDIVHAIATRAAIASRLGPRQCGDACDAVRKLMDDGDAFDVEVVPTEQLILPPRDTMDTVAPGLTPSERDRVQASPTSVVIRTMGKGAPEQLPARAAFAAAAVVADALDGFVWDEASRRIETAHDFATHTITAKLGDPVFAPRQIVVQLYRQDDGTARLLTLGMLRYGSPDVSLRGANMGSGPALVGVLNAAASQLAHGTNDTTLRITLEDVARVAGRKPSDLNPDPSRAVAVELDVVVPERVEGDPDNELAELVPKRKDGESSREAWEAVMTSLFGAPTSVEVHEGDKELAAVAEQARRDLPDAIRRFRSGEGELFVKGPFAIPDEARVDGGGATELLWLAAASCDDRACTGVLTNEPTYATNLAAGKITSVRRSEVVDWMLHQRDGGTLGGRSIELLERRARGAK